MADSHVFRIEIQRDNRGRRDVVGYIKLQSNGQVHVMDQGKTKKKRWLTFASHNCQTVENKVLKPRNDEELTLGDLGDFLSFTFGGPAKYDGARFSYVRIQRGSTGRAMGDWDAIDEGTRPERHRPKSSGRKSLKQSRKKSGRK